jgi:hypothetical protein
MEFEKEGQEFEERISALRSRFRTGSGHATGPKKWVPPPPPGGLKANNLDTVPIVIVFIIYKLQIL